MKLNNKKRQEPLFKHQTIVEYFRQQPNETTFYADNKPYLTIGNRLIFGKYKIIKASRMKNIYTGEYWYLWYKCKVVKL